MEQIVSAIRDLGFPIAVALGLWVQNNNMIKQHAEEMKAITGAINNNTFALTELKDKIGG